jgi:hypothetical protein
MEVEIFEKEKSYINIENSDYVGEQRNMEN